MASQRIILRRWQADDAPDLLSMASDQELCSTVGWNPHSSIQDSLDAINGILSRPGVRAIVSRSIGRPIGFIELDRCPMILRKGPKDAEVGFWIGREHWNQGYATEALNEVLEEAFDTGVSKVWGRCLEDNLPSIRVMEKCGMRYHHKGISESSVLGVVPTVFYVISKKDWKQGRR